LIGSGKWVKVGLGVSGEYWHSVPIDTVPTYMYYTSTNNLSYPIWISISFTPVPDYYIVQLTVDTINLSDHPSGAAGSNPNHYEARAIIPPGSSYTFGPLNGKVTINAFAELS